MNAVNVPDHVYDFNNEDNLAKWKGVLTTALKKVNKSKIFFISS